MLVGRGTELELVGSLLDRACRGHGQLLVVEGEAGIGKSALLAACAVRCRQAGALVLAGTGDELGATRPFAPLLDAFASAPEGRAAVVAVRRLLVADREGPVSPLETGPGPRSMAIDEVVVQVEELCMVSPVALLVDDLHWADGATMAALASLVRHAADLPLLVAVALRPVPSRPELDALRAAVARTGRGAPTTTVDVGPLSREEVGALASTLVGATVGPDLRPVLDRCGGNPLLVVELLSWLRAADRLTERDGAVDATATRLDELGLPPTFADTVLHRMADLDDDVRTLASVAALLGSRFTLGDLTAVTGRSAADLLPVVQTLVEARLVVDDGSALSYRHDLLREAVASALPPSVRTGLHREIASALQAAGAPTVRVAEQLALGAPPGSAEAVAVLRAAAAEVVHQDPTAAVGLLRRALELCRPSDPEHDLLVAQLVDALSWSGRVNEAQATAEAVLSRPVSAEAEIGLRSAVSRSLLLLGRPADALPHEELLVTLSRSLGRSTAWTLAESAVCRLFALDLDGALREAVDAVAEAEAGGGEEAAAILGLCVQAFGGVTLGDSARATDLATEAVRRADATPGGEGHRMHPHLFRGIALQSLGRPADATVSFDRGRTLGESLGASWALPIYHFLAALAHWDVGRWDDLLAEVDAGLAFGEERASSIGQVWAYGVAGRVAVHRGDLVRAGTLFDAGDAVVQEGGMQYGLDWLALGRALLAEAHGRRPEGLDLLRALWEGAAGLQASAALVTIGGDLARFAVDSGEDDVAREVAAELRRLVARSPDDLVVRGREARARGLVERDPDALLEAAEHFSGVNHRFEVAAVRKEAADALLVGGRGEAAGGLAEQALATFDELGALREADGARALLARLRPRQRRAAPRRAAVGWEALTATEEEVVDEVCRGQSNSQVAVRLGISRRTVEAHLRSIYVKLGVSSRLALAVERHERAATAPAS